MKPVAGYREDEWVKGRIASAEALGGQVYSGLLLLK